MEELPIIQKTYDLIKWYVPILNKLPRNHRFLLGDRTISLLYDLLEGLIQARYSHHKRSQLEALNPSLDILRYQSRLMLDFHLMDVERYEYLSGFDHFVKEQLKVKKYLRYVDDFALFADDRYFLQEAQIAIVEYLNTLRLKLHPIKTQITTTRIGVNFVGFRILPDRIKIRTANLRRARVRLKKHKKELEQGKIDLIAFKKSLQSWQAHLKHGDTHRLRQNIFESLGVTP